MTAKRATMSFSNNLANNEEDNTFDDMNYGYGYQDPSPLMTNEEGPWILEQAYQRPLNPASNPNLPPNNQPWNLNREQPTFQQGFGGAFGHRSTTGDIRPETENNGQSNTNPFSQAYDLPWEATLLGRERSGQSNINNPFSQAATQLGGDSGDDDGSNDPNPNKRKRDDGMEDTSKQDIAKVPFKGEVEDHPEWWGKYVDDGPQHSNENYYTYTTRVHRARTNMNIRRRELKVLIHRTYSSVAERGREQRRQTKEWADAGKVRWFSFQRSTSNENLI